MTALPASIDDAETLLSGQGYVASRALATVVFLSLRLGRPLFLEGEAGTGKTEIAKTIAQALGRRLIRLQCYEGLDAAQAIYAEKNFEFPVKPGVARSAVVQSWGDFTVDTVPLSAVAAARPAALKIMEEIDFDN